MGGGDFDFEGEKVKGAVGGRAQGIGSEGGDGRGRFKGSEVKGM